MATAITSRELILNILLEVNKDGEYSHIAIRKTLERYQYLPKQERSFITKVCEGTIEYMLQLDYIIEQFSSVKIAKMKPLVREILRSSVYQMKYMDRVPESAICNEAVKLTQKRGFYSLKGFVNGILRNIARGMDSIKYPPIEQPILYLSIKYSMPSWIVEEWVYRFGFESTESILADFLLERPTTIRCMQYRIDKELTIKQLEKEGVTVERAPYLNDAYYISNYNYITALTAFQAGSIAIQDLSSMLVGRVAAPKKGDYIIDMCAAPGGKSVHVADMMGGYGEVEARDLTEYKVALIEENIKRTNLINAVAKCQDATVFDGESVNQADIVLCDVPCSGLGVIAKKPDIKYKTSKAKIEELVVLQRKILNNAATYVKEGGTLIYSTCTISKEENEENIEWFTNNYPYELENIDSHLCEELRSETTEKGYLQLLPGVHKTDGFFVAKLRRRVNNGRN